jgi:hypothetical protein
MALNTDFKVKNSLYVSNSACFVTQTNTATILSAGTSLFDIFLQEGEISAQCTLSNGTGITGFNYDGQNTRTISISAACNTAWNQAYTWCTTNGNNVYDTITTSPPQGQFTISPIVGTPAVVDLGLQEDDSPTFAGLTLAGALAMGTNKITGLGTPTANADAATKAYVDSVGSGLVDSVTAGNGTITVNNTDAANPTVRIADTCVATLSTAFCTVANDTNQGNIGLTRLNGGSATLDIGLCTGDDVTFNKVDGTAGVCGNNIQIGVTGANEIDTSSGNITIDSAGGTTTLDDALIKIPNVAAGTSNTVILSSASGALVTDVINSRVWGSTLVDNGGTNLTSGKLPVASDADTIEDSIVSQATVGSNSTLTIGGSAIIQGDLTVTGDFTCLETLVQITSAVCIVNAGTGPALYAEQTGANQPIATFVDTEGGQVIFGDGGNVGIGTIGNVPGEKLTVSGNLSASGNLYIDGEVKFPGVVAGTSNTVILSSASGLLVTDVIDDKVWCGKLIESGTASTCVNNVPKFTSTVGTIGTSNISDTGTLITLNSDVTYGNGVTVKQPSAGGTVHTLDKVYVGTVGTSATTVATFLKSGMNSVKYEVTLKNGVNITTFEVHAVYNGTAPCGTVYAIVDAQAASQLVEVEITSTSTTIDLDITAASAGTQATIYGKAKY